MPLPDFLEGLRVTIAEGLGITMVHGEIEGPLELEPESTGFGCLWPTGWEEVEGDVYHETLPVTVRIFLPIQQEFTPTEPLPTAGLVALRASLIDVLRPYQSMQFGVKFFRLTDGEFFPREQRLDARIVGWQFADFQKPVGA